MPNAKMTTYNSLVDNKSIFDQLLSYPSKK